MLLAPNKITPASLFTFALLAFPAIGLATDADAATAPVKVSAASGQASGGAVSLKVQNRTRSRLAGKLTAKAGRTAAGSASYRARARKTAKVRMTLSTAARRKLAADSRLRLSVTATANATCGTYAVSAATAGAATPASFSGPVARSTGRPGTSFRTTPVVMSSNRQ